MSMPENKRDVFGFGFWLIWILAFGGSFIVSALFWTAVLMALFGPVREPELAVSWALAVFGCWFLLFSAFMRKKERIWKRLNRDEEKAVEAWLLGLGCFIGALILSCIGWAFYYKEAIYSDGGSMNYAWLKAAGATWLGLVLPFLAFLYKKADRIFKDAAIRQAQAGPRFRTLFLEKGKRMLTPELSEKIKSFPEIMEGGHIVNLTLKNSLTVPDVFILNGREILGIYDAEEMNFSAEDVASAEAPAALPEYQEDKWLRLDGRA